MTMRAYFLLLLSSISGAALSAQNTPAREALDHDAFDHWKRIEAPQISHDGRWVAYTLRAETGDPTLIFYDGLNDREFVYARAEGAQISADSRFAAFLIKAPADTVKAMRRRKVKKEDLPKDTLALLSLLELKLEKIPRVKSFSLPQRFAGWLAYQLEPDSARAAQKGPKPEGSPLIIRSLRDHRQDTVVGVTAYQWAERAARLLLASAGRDSAFAPGVYLFSEGAGLRPLLRAKGKYTHLTLEENGRQAAFLADLDTTKTRVRPQILHAWREGADSARAIADNSAAFLPKDWIINEHRKLEFSKDGAKLFFGVSPAPLLPDTTLLDEEIVQVEVWNYLDDRLYPQQAKELEQDKKKGYDCMWRVEENRFVKLGAPEHPNVILGDEGRAEVALAHNDAPYRLRATWEGFPVCKDLYILNLRDGEKKRIATEVCGNPQLSPGAKFAYWYSHPDSTWKVYWIEKDLVRAITDNDKAPFHDELNDRPEYPGPYGLAGWTTEDDFVMVYDRYDIWLIDPRGQMPPNNLTRGRAERKRYRYIKLDPDERSIEEVKPMLLHVFDEKTKSEGYVWYNVHTGFGPLLGGGPYAYSSRVLKARDADRWVFTRENFQTFPDLLYSRDLRQFKRISQANPQQARYRWGTIELVEWTALDGQRLQGLLVKPEGFDPNKKYPLLVNFYERSSDGLHQHRAPQAHRSTINYSFYASRGYLIFNPDVPYRVGYPGESAFNAVIPGVAALIDRGFVDKERIGVQGHSWGGYQVAHLLTKTDLFRCAESGAPVVNMISAYGGIRWESGLSRIFQYERSQSRIGGSLWEYPLRYLENSPVFFLDKVKTPVLILHNDQDGAVPWYQGIEYFVGLRRLGKPAWLLNYNGEPHWPLKYQNRRDFQLRMQQFFDHYLLDASMPQWMREGVPAIKKGIEQGLELVGGDEE
jgi:dipeptidyl aminopeptidase/acylaminoacyl peptidase